VGLFYTARVKSGGGTKPYTWTLEGLPSWLSFDPDSGILSGTPGEASIHDLTARVKDGEGNTDSKLLRLSVHSHDGLTVMTRVLPAAIQGKEYSASLKVSGGIPPYVFALRRGSSLPPGLTLDNDGTLSGTPSQRGTYSFVIDAMDGNNLQGSGTYTMAILDAEALAPDNDDFTVKEYEDQKRIRLSFFLPKNFDNAKILSVEALVSPDSYVAGSSSAITKGENGSKTDLTLQVAESALSRENRSELLEELTFEGITVKFQDASGEEMRFEEALLVKDLRREEEPEPDEPEDSNGSDSGGGGCNVGWGLLLPSLALIVVPRARKRG
jgi:hypothetical protein